MPKNNLTTKIFERYETLRLPLQKTHPKLLPLQQTAQLLHFSLYLNIVEFQHYTHLERGYFPLTNLD